MENPNQTSDFNHYNHSPLAESILSNKTETAVLLIRRGALVGADFNSLLLTAIDQNNHTIVKELVDYEMQVNPSIDLRTSLNSAISQGHLQIIEHIIPHCQFLEPSDQYIPRELVMRSRLQYNECVELLLKWNFTVNPVSKRDKDFIYAAVENGYLSIFSQLLTFGIDVNMVNPNTGLNLLAIACLNKHHEIVEKLLENNANVNMKIPDNYCTVRNRLNSCYLVRQFDDYLSLVDNQSNFYDVTYLHIAVSNSDLRMTELLLRYGAKIIDDPKFFNLTCIAIENCCEEIVRIFLEHGVNVTDIGPQGKSLLRTCVYSNSDRKDLNYNIAKLFLEKGAITQIQTPGNTFFFDSIKNGHQNLAQLFLDYNADFQYIDPDGNTPLHKAIEKDFDVEFITTLLELYLPVDAKNNYGLTALHIACKITSKNQLKIIETLVHYNANINCTNNTLKTPLHLACEAPNLKVVTFLLKNGANSNATNNADQTALHIVCSHSSNVHGVQNLIRSLLEHGANIEAVDLAGWTPLLIACSCRNNAAVECLLRNHANANYTRFGNFAALFLALENESIKIIENLLKYGADINMLDRRNRAVLQYALGMRYSLINYKEIIKILKRQVVILKVAGFNVIDQNLNLVYNSNPNEDDVTIDIPQLNTECQQEMEEMKLESIGNDNITFYDLLKKNIHILSRLVNNEEVQEILELCYDKEFPLYIDIIRNRMREAQVRYRMMNSATEYFRINVCRKLPNECIDMIFSYLSIEDLNRFIRAMKPLNE